MKKLICILFVIALAAMKADAAVWTTLVPHDNGWNYYYSEPIKLKHQDGKLTYKLCVAQKRSTGELSYFIFYLPPEPEYLKWTRPENAPKNYKKGFIMKVRDGKNNVIDMTVTTDKAWKIEKITQKTGETLKGDAIFDTTHKIDQIEVCYRVSKDDFYNIVDNGIKKVREENTSPDRYFDYNFSEKQTESSAKDLRKHLNNMLKKVDEIEKKLVVSRKQQSGKPQKKAKKEIGEF